MNMPSRGSRITVDGYGTGIFAGAHIDGNDDDCILLKFEGHPTLDSGYGRGIIEVPLTEYQENRIYPEQFPDGELPSVSTEKRDAIFEERFGETWRDNS